MSVRSLFVGVAIAAIGASVAGCSLFQAAKRPAAEMTVASTPERVARGSYLVNHVTACFACHSTLDAESHMPLAGLKGAGGRAFSHSEGLPGSIVATNLTPDARTGLGTWTDGEVIRAVREGVSKDGHALFPIMPYPGYRAMSDDDAYAIVAYLRTLAPVAHETAARTLDFPLNLIVNTIPKPLDGPVAPAPSAKADKLAHGRYVMQLASCAECHTPRAGGGPDKSKLLGGGYPFPEGEHVFWMPNLTPDAETGLGKWTDAQIEAAVRYGSRPDGGRLSPVMPWPYYNGMSREDMDSLIAYLRTVPAVTSPPAPAKAQH
jgi:mono/diheme cytochrome c family protein